MLYRHTSCTVHEQVCVFSARLLTFTGKQAKQITLLAIPESGCSHGLIKGHSVMPEPKSEQEVISRFQQMRQAVRVSWEKLNDIEAGACCFACLQLLPLMIFRRMQAATWHLGW
jgi:hypothetical protein